MRFQNWHDQPVVARKACEAWMAAPVDPAAAVMIARRMLISLGRFSFPDRDRAVERKEPTRVTRVGKLRQGRVRRAKALARLEDQRWRGVDRGRAMENAMRGVRFPASNDKK